MEDDILFNPNINKKIKILNNNLPNNYDIIHLGCDGMSCLYPKLFKINYNKYFYKNSNLLVGTWCYMISNNGARKILKYYENNNVGHIDRAFTENKNIDLFIFKNPLVKHYNNNFYSNQYSLNNLNNNEHIINLNTPQFYIRPLNINFTFKNVAYYYLFLFIIIILCYVLKIKKIYDKYINLFLFLIIILLFIPPFIFYFFITYFKYKYYI
jgi:GR25 family glycosyltransferase involved in LPS biosynthesis